jgi:excisionase family DNA binding protein
MTIPALLDALDDVIREGTPEEIALILGRFELARHDAIERVRPQPHQCKTESDEDVLLMPEVARLLHVNEETAREMGRKGKIPTVRRGGRGVGVRRGALREHLRQSERRVLRPQLVPPPRRCTG